MGEAETKAAAKLEKVQDLVNDAFGEMADELDRLRAALNDRTQQVTGLAYREGRYRDAVRRLLAVVEGRGLYSPQALADLCAEAHGLLDDTTTREGT